MLLSRFDSLSRALDVCSRFQCLPILSISPSNPPATSGTIPRYHTVVRLLFSWRSTQVSQCRELKSFTRRNKKRLGSDLVGLSQDLGRIVLRNNDAELTFLFDINGHALSFKNRVQAAMATDVLLDTTMVSFLRTSHGPLANNSRVRSQ